MSVRRFSVDCVVESAQVEFNLSVFPRSRRSYSISHSYHTFFVCCNVYHSFAADGCIFHLETLTRSLGDKCIEKEYLIALVDIGRAVSIAKTSPWKRYDDEARAELLDAINLQQYVPSTP